MAYIGRMDFEWDEAKARANQHKHGVAFADAVGVLFDFANVTWEDPDAQGEARYITLGRDYYDRVLLVVWTEPDEALIRIISARRAQPGERQYYRE